MTNPRERARLLDEASDAWPGTGLGSSSQSRCSSRGPRCGWRGVAEPARTPRAALGRPVPIGLPGPEALAELAAEIREGRPDLGPFDLITELPPETDLGTVEGAGLTSALTFSACSPPRRGPGMVDAGPG